MDEVLAENALQAAVEILTVSRELGLGDHAVEADEYFDRWQLRIDDDDRASFRARGVPPTTITQRYPETALAMAPENLQFELRGWAVDASGDLMETIPRSWPVPDNPLPPDCYRVGSLAPATASVYE
jgi:hypothetical protein